MQVDARVAPLTMQPPPFHHAQERMENASLLIPIGGLRMIRNLAKLSQGRLVMLVGDKVTHHSVPPRPLPNSHIHTAGLQLRGRAGVEARPSRGGAWLLLDDGKLSCAAPLLPATRWLGGALASHGWLQDQCTGARRPRE